MDGLRQVSQRHRPRSAHAARPPAPAARGCARAGHDDRRDTQPRPKRRIAEADGLLETFSALLRIAQIEAGAQKSGFADVDLSALLRSVGEAYAAVGRGFRHKLELEIEDGVTHHRRPPAAGADGLQPGRERAAPHAGRHDRARWRCANAGRLRGRGRRQRPRHSRGRARARCSTASTASTAAARRRAAASAWRWSRRSRHCTASRLRLEDRHPGLAVHPARDERAGLALDSAHPVRRRGPDRPQHRATATDRRARHARARRWSASSMACRCLPCGWLGLSSRCAISRRRTLSAAFAGWIVLSRPQPDGRHRAAAARHGRPQLRRRALVYSKSEVIQVALFSDRLPGRASVLDDDRGDRRGDGGRRAAARPAPPARPDLTALFGLAAGTAFAISIVAYRGANLALGADSPFLAAAETLFWSQGLQTLLLGRLAAGAQSIGAAGRIASVAAVAVRRWRRRLGVARQRHGARSRARPRRCGR